MRVFHGITGSAGQPSALAAALRAQGVDARSAIIGANKMGYTADDVVICSPFDHKVIGRYLVEAIDRFDIFHLHMRPFFYQHHSNFFFPTFQDLLLLKAAGKRICFHFRGSEVRLASVFREKNPFHYVDDDPEKLIARFTEASQRRYMRFAASLADRVFVTDPELQTYVPNSEIVPRVFDPSRLAQPRPLRTENPVIVHAPSRRGVKGTGAVLAAVETLRREGLAFEFRLIEGLSHAEALEAYANCDVIVDQLRIGWYGVLAVEGMALGRTVVSYVREDLTESFGERMPIANANPDTVADVLRRCITDAAFRRETADAGRAWFDKTHSPASVASLLRGKYEEVSSQAPHLDVAGVQAMLEYQTELFDAVLRGDPAVALSWPTSAMSLWQKFRVVSRENGLRYAVSLSRDFLLRKVKSHNG